MGIFSVFKNPKFKEKFIEKNKKSPREPTKLIAIRLPISVYNNLQSLSKETNTTLTDAIIEALRHSL